MKIHSYDLTRMYGDKTDYDEKHISHLLLEYDPPDDVVKRILDVWKDFSL